MAQFPPLKTGAIAQYPVTRKLTFSNQALRFVDGSEQRYRYSAAPLREWSIRLERLDEGEVAVIEEFFRANQGSFEDFAFEDPWDGQIYSHCSLQSDGIVIRALTDMRGVTEITVVENRT